MAQQQNQLQVVGESHPLIRQLNQHDALVLMDQYLEHTELTGKQLITDLMAQLTVQPKLLRCSPESLYHCLIYAAQRKQTFGPYGVWIVPREITVGQGQNARKVLKAIPQLSYQAKNTVARERGAFVIDSEVVLKGEKFEAKREGGIIVDVIHEVNYMDRPLPTKDNTVGAWGVVVLEDGRRFFRVLAKHELDRARDAAASKAGPWATDYRAQCKKTVEHRLNEDFVGDFTRGGVAAPAPDDDGEPEVKVVNEGGDLADELNSRRQATTIDAMDTEEALEVVARTGSIDVLRMFYEQERGRQEAPGARKRVMEALKARKAELEAEEPAEDAEFEEVEEESGDGQDEQAGGAAPEETGNPPTGSPDAPPTSPEQPAEDAAPDESGNGAPPEQSGGGNPDGAPAGSPPPFPDLPGTLTDYEGDPKTALGAAIVEIKDAWKKLKKSPDSVEALFKRRQQEWGGAFDQAEHNQYPVLKQTVAAVLEAAGLPHAL